MQGYILGPRLLSRALARFVVARRAPTDTAPTAITKPHTRLFTASLTTYSFFNAHII